MSGPRTSRAVSLTVGIGLTLACEAFGVVIRVIPDGTLSVQEALDVELRGVRWLLRVSASGTGYCLRVQY